MDSLGAVRKRGRPDGNGAFTGSKRMREGESAQPGLGSKSKPCTKFFSTSGCPFGEGCHFLHYVRGGINAVAQMTNLGSHAVAPPPLRNAMHHLPSIPDGGAPSAATKTRLCKKYNTAEGCRFGERCNFAHGERELGKPVLASTLPPSSMGGGGRFPEHLPPPAGAGAAASFGASATAKISVDASLAGAIIGKGGVNTKQINRVTGVKLFIRDHESDASQKNIELEGTFDQIKQASSMVTELILNITPTAAAPPPSNYAGRPAKYAAAGPSQASAGNNFKTKMCENFAKGTCTFGDRCHFAHGANELRKSAAV